MVHTGNGFLVEYVRGTADMPQFTLSVIRAQEITFVEEDLCAPPFLSALRLRKQTWR